ncbi:MAG: immunity 26/phosphotriesterase HocA family protein [Chlorobi bacterium]|nr:immunity 26/phosphotriesterase HocA family protein [Chlorobiota bacterium]
MKRQRITLGSIIKIDLGDGYHSYGRILRNAGYGFYDIRTKEEISDMEEIVDKAILFIVAVYDDAITRGHWLKVGKMPLEPSLEVMPNKFIQDGLHPDQFSLYDPNTGAIYPSTREACRGLERAAVWEPEHVEERLRDHFAGRKNRLVEKDRLTLYGSVESS